MEPSKPKRQKTGIACDPCRRTKMKCNGNKPVCGRCAKRPSSEAACTWATDPTRMLRAQDMHRASNTQRNQIQGNNRAGINSSSESVPQTTGSQTPGSQVAAPTTSPERTTWPTILPAEGSSFINTLASTPGTSTDLRPSPSATFIVPRLAQRFSETVEAISILHANDHSVHDDVVGHGHSQGPIRHDIARNFMHEVEKAITEKLDGASQPTPRVVGQSYDSTQKDSDFPLPAREQADSLLSSYWNYVHVLYPFLDKPQMQENYDKIWTQEISSIRDKKSFFCLLNSIFAISSRQVRLAAPDHEKLAATFCSRARELLEIESWSLRSIQSYLLLALYYQSIDEHRTCWMFAGMAIRTALAKEFHLPETSERQPDSQSRDLLRKVWHGCVLVDREVSMMYGRPCMIDQKTAAAVPLPLMMEEEIVQQQGSTQRQQTHAADFYESCFGLYDILHDVLHHLYSSKSQAHLKNGGSDSEHFLPLEGATSIVELEQRLSKWENKIPNYYEAGIRSPYTTSINGLLVRRAAILRQRHLHIHLLLLRPMLQSFITFEFRNKGESISIGSLLSHRVSLQCTIVCVKMAQEAIDTIYVNEGTSSNEMRDLSAWWHNAIFLYTSATALIAASLSPSVVADVPEDSIYDSFHKAISVLRQYTIFNKSISRLTSTLHILSSTVPKNYSRLKQQASQGMESNADGFMSEAAKTAATFQYWCPMKPGRRQASPPKDPKAHSNSEQNGQDSSSESLSNLDRVFDADDFTWLTTIPFYT